MLSKCMNPECLTRFLYLHEGRLFKLELRAPNRPGGRIYKTEHFWLCDKCACSLTVVFSQGVATTRPLQPGGAPAAPKAEEEKTVPARFRRAYAE